MHLSFFIAMSVTLAALGGILVYRNGNYLSADDDTTWYSPEDLKKRKYWLTIKVVVVILILCLSATAIITYFS